MAGDEDNFQSTDERIGNMFRSTIAPLPDPDEAYVNRALASRAAASVTPSGGPPAAATPTEAEPWYKRMGREAAAGEMRAGKAAETTLGQIPAEDTASAGIEKKVQGEITPIQSRDAQGKVLPEYRATTGQKILRGFTGFGRGLREGGVVGAAEGAIDPRSTYSQDDPRRQYAGYGDPNKTYQTAETNRLRNLTADTQNLQESQKRFKEATDRLKATSQEQRALATTYKDAGATANTAEERETQAQKERDTANKPAPEPKTADELALALSTAKQNGDKQAIARYSGAIDEIKKMKAAERAPKDTTAQDIAKAIQVAEFRTSESLKIDNQKEQERSRRYAEIDKDVKVKYDANKVAAAKQQIDTDLEAKYGPKYDDVKTKADDMLGLTKAGQKLQAAATSRSSNTSKTSKPNPKDYPLKEFKGHKAGDIVTLKNNQRVRIIGFNDKGQFAHEPAPAGQ